MTDIDDAFRDYLELRRQADSAQLATLDANRLPEASYAPIVWLDDGVYLFLSDLAAHARNLRHNPALGLILVDAGDHNPFARRRISLQCQAELVPRKDPRFTPVMTNFRDRFGGIMELLEPLADFNLFRARIERGGFVRGFGQAYVFEGANPERLEAIDPRASGEDNSPG